MSRRPRRGRRRAPAAGALVVLLVALAAGCGEKSRVDPNAQVHVRGSVLGVDGNPLVTRPVHLGAGITDSEVGLAIFTVGLSCTTGACRGKQFDTSTDPAGSYLFTLKGSDSRSTFGEAVSELVSASAAPGAGQVSGAAVSARFKIQVAEVQLPVLHLVDPRLQVSNPAPALHAEWSPVAPGPYDLTFENGTTAAVWKVTSASPAADLDPRVLEDTSGRVVVSGDSSDQIEGSKVDIHWRSPGIGYAGVSAAPPSRGKACRLIAADGSSSNASPCGLTDGNLADAVGLSAVCGAASTTSCAPATAVDIDLGSAVPAELVVVRGCASACPVSVSADGSTFAPVGTAPVGDSTIALDGSAVTTVRIGVDPAASTSLREVSVWGPTPALRQPSASSLGALRNRFGGGGSGSSSDRTVAVVVASVLAAVLLLVLGIIIGRRRGRHAQPI